MYGNVNVRKLRKMMVKKKMIVKDHVWLFFNTNKSATAGGFYLTQDVFYFQRNVAVKVKRSYNCYI